MRKLKLLAISTLTTIALIMALTLAACGGDPPPTPNEPQDGEVDEPGNCFHKSTANTHAGTPAHQAHPTDQPWNPDSPAPQAH